MVIAVDLRPLSSGTLSGVEIYTINLVKNLLRIDKKNRYVLYINSFQDKSALLRSFKGANVTYLQTDIPNKILNLFLAVFRFPKLDKLIFKKTGRQPDIYFIPDLRPAPVSKKVKKILTVHDLAFYHYPQFFSLKSRLWYRYINPGKEFKESDRIISVSEFTALDLIRSIKLNKKKITVIHEGVDKDFFEGKKNIDKKKYNLPDDYFLFLSTVEPRKNLWTLIQAFKEFKTAHQGIKLVVAGQTNTKLFKKMDLPSDRDIIFTGFVDQMDKPGLYAHARALVYPSVFEGFGLPLLEAMACGTPIITSNRSALPEVAGEAALLIDPANWKDLVRAMDKIMDEKTVFALKTKMAARIKIFSWEKCARETLEVFESTCRAECSP